MTDDGRWPPEMYELAPNDYLAAFGQATLLYNMLESVMSHLFVVTAPLPDEYALRLFHNLNNRDRIDLLSAFVRKNEIDPIVADALLHCILCYDICTENRNILMHSTYFEMYPSDTKTTAPTRLVKRASKDPKRELHFDVPLAELRYIADKIAEIFVYARELYGFTFRRKHRAFLGAEPLQSSALPDKPPKPRILIPYQPGAVRKGVPPPPPPSGG